MHSLSADEQASHLGQQDVGHEGVASGRGALSLPSPRPHLRGLASPFIRRSLAHASPNKWILNNKVSTP